ncbi:four-carbon acid sugar kinase family protein [Sporosarcina sp. ACRSM]|uniref:four-carbon acid sugar kinase family protein n=1 Tax=Sporosarcina sp. ACRSM TaxID=2918216 RepID=UPI001EF65670|nr:four-carbon acid sugar kinase family protein [Sporosarcina sp. ACRSM]MCG7334735.1 four-carbon acid sugar kinase family protein [Sporosarcina sp. ACRSM]
MIKPIGVVADDTTGANDIGLMFSHNQYSAKVVTYGEDESLEVDSNVMIIDTDSRLDSPDLSYEKVYKATKALQGIGCSLFFNKTCSVFRGNIGKEFDAMLDALGEEFAIISLAFPKNGRQTKNAVHTVHGKLLEDSEFSRDPVHPMYQSNLVDILQGQTKRKVTFIDIETVRRGASVLRTAIEERRKEFNYCLIDSETQADLTIVAEAVHDYKVLGGSSAIAEELPKFLQVQPISHSFMNLDLTDDLGVLVVSGSLTPQTRAQTAYLISSGVPSIVLDSRKIFVHTEREKEVRRVFEAAQLLLRQGKDVLMMANNEEEVVLETKEMGLKLNIDPLLISKMVSATLADITGQIENATSLKKLVIAGGNTSGTVSRKLGIKGNYILEEIETGVPSGLALGRHMLIVLKSGSFGKPDFLVRAVAHLKDLSY